MEFFSDSTSFKSLDIDSTSVKLFSLVDSGDVVDALALSSAILLISKGFLNRLVRLVDENRSNFSRGSICMPLSSVLTLV